MRYVAKALLLSGALLAVPQVANAATYTGPTTYFYLTGDYSANFRVDTGTTLTDPDENGFQIVRASGVFPGSLYGNISDVIFYTSPLNFGGLEIDDNEDPDGNGPLQPNGPLVNAAGPQLFTGDPSSPTFTLGTFSLQEFEGRGQYSLRVTNVADAVPEPATWAMIVVGFGAIGFAMRRRTGHNVSVRFA